MGYYSKFRLSEYLLKDAPDGAASLRIQLRESLSATDNRRRIESVLTVLWLKRKGGEPIKFLNNGDGTYEVYSSISNRRLRTILEKISSIKIIEEA